ncbi:3-hydroxy-5-phosphonooxypentane-2,4-dione thiolase [Reinekea marinisedimentorum]|uniref:Putative autoinducer-2 (AI-2) aldolase n=1 Tax=Reinekea marinisedimentorum TaxID=230495 RepID=A0A4R3I626_9GAMM|nr:3-hydroxy-5-phosphonooxypentane-2,4-dione thiolase [Reinekea marinisedimentorum]TCS41148.1 putative autoinducer-2 (AI-2) aldolase [Reinekea marinisedimentorum]
MADADGMKQAKDYGLDTPQMSQGFHVKGMGHADWGMKNRLSRIFNPATSKTVMLAFDHGYIMGAAAGLERLDLTIDPLAPYADALMATRGALRSCINPAHNKPVILRASAGSTVLKDDMSHEVLGVEIDDAVRMNASCLAVQVFIGASGECSSLKNLVNAIDSGARYSIPTMGVTAVGKEMERTNRYFMLACRVLAELGAHIVKTYYCEDFEKIAAACPVPIVVAGGKKLPELNALKLAHSAIQQGAAGVDMGRNVFQSDCPVGMIKAINAVVHNGFTPEQALDLYETEKASLLKEGKR